jgi:flagellar biogenesis protein FliO
MLHLRAIVLIFFAALPAAAAAQELASRPRSAAAPQSVHSLGPAAATPLPLSSPGGENPPGKPSARWSSHSPVPSLGAMLTSLLIVVGLFLLVAWLLRKSLPSGGRSLPPDVVEVLGRVQLAPRQPAQLVRIGHKLILVSISAAGVRTLAEITDPLEVDRLAGLCRQAHPQSSSAAFRQVFQQFGRQPASGFLDDESEQGAVEPAVDAREIGS